MKVDEILSAPFDRYSSEVLSIIDKQSNLIPFTLNFAQQYVHEKIEAQLHETGRVRAIILKARQEGISTYVAARFFRRVQTRPYQSALVIADIEKRAGSLFNIYDRFDRHLAEEFRPMKRSIQRSKMLAYGNPDKTKAQSNPGLDSQIEVVSARDANAGRGQTPHMAHLSEMAFWEHGEDTFISLMQGIPDDGSEVIIESTAQGAGDLFHRTWKEAEAGENGFIAIFIPWWIMAEYARPVSSEDERNIRDTMDDFERRAYIEGIEWEGEKHLLSLEQLQWRRETFRQKCQSDWTRFAQEYPATAEEAFQVSGAQFFDPEAVRDYQEMATPPLMRGMIQENLKTDEETGETSVVIEIVKDPQGWVRIWDEPDEEGHYVLGVDTASGKLIGATRGSFNTAQSERGGRDFSCAQVWDVYNAKVVANLHARCAPEVFADMAALLGGYYKCRLVNHALIGVERNHTSGQTVINRLLDVIAYPRMYLRREFNQRLNRNTREFGWVTTKDSRPLMLDELAAMLRNGTIGIPDPDTLREMSTFVRRDDGSPEAQEGLHDDRVLALAIAIQVAKTHGCPTGALPPTLTFAPLQGEDDAW